MNVTPSPGHLQDLLPLFLCGQLGLISLRPCKGELEALEKCVRPPSAHAEVAKPCVYSLFAWLKFCVRTFRDAPAPRRELDWESQHQAGSSVDPKDTLGDAPAPSTCRKRTDVPTHLLLAEARCLQVFQEQHLHITQSIRCAWKLSTADLDGCGPSHPCVMLGASADKTSSCFSAVEMLGHCWQPWEAVC